MKQRRLSEDRLPPRLIVIFSSKLSKEINAIDNCNQNNIQGLAQWYDYLEGIRNYISNPVIAFDYTDRYIQFPNGARYIRDFDYNVGYTIKTNNKTQEAFVYVFMLNLKPYEFGLKTPQTKNGNSPIQITESDLKMMVRKVIRRLYN